jgi:hypothetical protein
MMRFLIYLSIGFSLVFTSCNSSGGLDNTLDVTGSDITKESVNLTVKIGYDETILEKQLSKVLKRVQMSDVASIQLTIFDSQKSYVVDQVFNKTASGSWELEVYNLPANSDLTLIAEGFDVNSYRILSGTVSTQLSIDSVDVTIPLSLAKTEAVISVPTIKSINGGTAGDSRKRLTFTITNPNSEFVTWRVTPDTALSTYGEFNQTFGQLDFRFKSQLSFSIDFVGNLGTMFFENKLDINSSVGDVTTTFFKIYEQRDIVKVSLAPIVDNIYLTFYDNRVEAHGIIDSKLLKTEVCSNNFDDLFSEFVFRNKSFEELFKHFYSSTSNGEVDVDEVLTILKSEINSSEESNLSKMLNLDINHTFTSLFQMYQTQYGYTNEKFNKIYDYLTDPSFSKMLDYYSGDEKSLLLTLKSFYKEDTNLTSVISTYEDRFGESSFSNLIDYMITSSQSTLLLDFNEEDQNFTNNGDFYYAKFGDNNSSLRLNLNLLVTKIKDYNFQEFLKLFGESGVRLYILMQFYFDDYSIYDPAFAKLLNFRVDENFEKLYANLKSKHNNLDSFLNFSELVENRDFTEFLEYYKNPTTQLYNSIKAKYDQDICITENFGLIDYSWSLQNSSLEIENPYTNPITIANFAGTLQDTILLEARNENGVVSEYSYHVNIKNWFDNNGNPINIYDPEDNETLDDDPANPQNPDNNDTTNPSDGTDYAFSLFADKTNVNLLYGETTKVRFTTSKRFEDFEKEILGVVNSTLFAYSIADVSTTTETIYELTLTARNLTGTASLSFVVQNSYHSEVANISLTISNPIQILELKQSYTVLQTHDLNISVKVANSRGDTLQFSLIDDSDVFDAWRSGSSQFTTGTADGVIYNFVVRGLSEGEENLTLVITDTTMEPDYQKIIPIIIKVEPLDETAVTNELAKFSCGTVQLSSLVYEYTDDEYDTSGNSVYSGDSAIQVQSLNSVYVTNSYLSRVVILHPGTTGYTGSDYGTFYLYNQQTKKSVGIIKYAPTMADREFYAKYYDSATNSVICEKHKFSPF